LVNFGEFSKLIGTKTVKGLRVQNFCLDFSNFDDCLCSNVSQNQVKSSVKSKNLPPFFQHKHFYKIRTNIIFKHQLTKNWNKTKTKTRRFVIKSNILQSTSWCCYAYKPIKGYSSQKKNIFSKFLLLFSFFANFLLFLLLFTSYPSKSAYIFFLVFRVLYCLF
jgi:hypothetical protein